MCYTPHKLTLSTTIMSKKSFFKFFDDFTSNQIAKLSEILDPQPKKREVISIGEHPGSWYSSKKIDNGIVAGLDIGSSKVTLVAGKLNSKGKIDLIAFAEESCDGLIRGSISNINKISAAITQVLAKATAQANVPINQVYASYSGTITNHIEHGVFLRKDIAGEINEGDIALLRKEMHNTLLPAGERLIYMQPKPFTIDSEPGIMDPVGMAGQRIEADFQLVTANVTPIEYLFKCCTQAKINLLEVIPASIASAEAVLCDDEMEEGVAIIDIGAAVTSVAVYSKGNLLHAENFPLGSNNISLDIRDFTGLQLRQAELLKNQFGSVNPDEMQPNEIIEVKILNGTKIRQVSRRELCQVIKSRTEELISIAYSIIIEAMKTESLTVGVVLTGGLSAMPYFKELAQEVTRTPCHLGNTRLHLEDQNSLPEKNYELLKKPGYATAIGLLKIGLQS